MASKKKSYLDNELIMKRRKRRRRRRLFLFFVVIITIFVTLSYKLPYFNVNSIIVNNNKVLSSEIIVESSGLKSGNNVFFVNFREAKKKILSNPYILNCSITRKLPSTFVINVEERKASYYIEENSSYYIIDNKGILLEVKENIEGFNLIRLEGVNLDSEELGSVFISGENKEKVLSVLDNLQGLIDRGLIDEKKKSLGLNDNDVIPVKKIDFSELYNIKISYNQINILCGDGTKLEEDLTEAINIIDQQKLYDKKGYIDLSFNGNPVYYIQP